jgi:hypothetical protein
MTATRERRDRIDAYRCDATGEIAPAHYLGRTARGYPIYHHEPGWTPVAMRDGRFEPSTRLRMTLGGDWVVMSR